MTVDSRHLSRGRSAASATVPVRLLGERLAVVSAGARLDERSTRALARSALSAADDGARELVLDLSAVRQHTWPSVYALCELEAHLTEACCDAVAVVADERLAGDLRAVGLQRAWALCGALPHALAELLARPVG